jgi:hypothetical protein
VDRRRLASDERTCSIDDLGVDLLSRQQRSATLASRDLLDVEAKER